MGQSQLVGLPVFLLLLLLGVFVVVFAFFFLFGMLKNTALPGSFQSFVSGFASYPVINPITI